ncbi:hypothetical protein TSUD_317750, partial [Trifolium subterraneum]
VWSRFSGSGDPDIVSLFRSGTGPRIPIWYDVKLLVAAWLVLPQFKGAAYLYERFVRDHIRKYVTEKEHQRVHHHPPPPPPEKQQQNKKLSPSGSKTKKKFVDFILPKKGDQEAY